MQAWQFVGVHQPLRLHDIPEPAAGPGEVVIDVRAAGMCHSDVGALESGDFVPFPVPVPVTFGHEVAGVIAELGSGVEGWQVGDRVAVFLGQTNPIGFARNGGYQSRLLLGTDDLVCIPDGVKFEHAAVATDAGVTAHLAVITAGRVRSEHKVGIIGYGGLGQFGAQIATAVGAEVYVAEPKREVWAGAASAGAVRVVSDITELGDVGLDVVVDFAGSNTTRGAVDAVRDDGRVVQIGLGQQTAEIDIWSLVMRNITLVGALGGTKDNLTGVLDLLAAGKMDLTLDRVSFGNLPDALERLRIGDVHGRVVVEPR